MASLDMSLDDMIKSRRTTERGRGQVRARRGRGGSSFNGGRMRGLPNRGGGSLRVNTARPSARNIAKSTRRTKGLPWQRDLLEESLRAVGLPGIDIDNGAKLFVSNLDSGVSNEDIRELFSEIGELKRYAIHYDKNGRPSGSAEVVFSRRSDAFQALKRYNNVQLDGMPMKIEISGANSDIPVLARGNVVGVVNGKRTVVMKSGMTRGRGSNMLNRNTAQRSRSGISNGRGGMTSSRGRGGGRGRGDAGGRGRGDAGGRGRGDAGGRGGRRGRGGGRGGKKNVDKSADQLDKELESYHAEAMQT